MTRFSCWTFWKLHTLQGAIDAFNCLIDSYIYSREQNAHHCKAVANWQTATVIEMLFTANRTEISHLLKHWPVTWQNPTKIVNWKMHFHLWFTHVPLLTKSCHDILLMLCNCAMYWLKSFLHIRSTSGIYFWCWWCGHKYFCILSVSWLYVVICVLYVAILASNCTSNYVHNLCSLYCVRIESFCTYLHMMCGL